MKKIILVITFLFFIFSSNIVFADIIPTSVYVITESDLNHNNLREQETLSLIAYDNYELSDGVYIDKHEVLNVKIKEYVEAKRGKRNAYYKIQYIDKQNNVFDGTMRIATPKDLKGVAISAGVSVVGKVLKVPGFSQALAVSKGLISPDEEGRLKTASKNLYESTPLTYAEKGKEFFAEKDSVLVLKLKQQQDE